MYIAYFQTGNLERVKTGNFKKVKTFVKNLIVAILFRNLNTPSP